MKSLETSNGASGTEEMVKCRRYEMILRMMGLVFTLVAAVVAGTNKDTESVAIFLVDGLPPLHLTLTAKWNYMSSTVYFVAVNAVACAYATISMVFPALITGGNRGRKWKDSIVLVVALDLTMVAVLFSANGASAAIGVIALNGNSHTQWHKVCYAFKRYCIQGGAAILISMFGSFFFICLVLLFTFNLHKTTLNY
ncbi:CASP-like protein 1E1 [Solanum dulcamara]|uniref:CASP-like protein 1E1 n=1 Tax=Solanum dulcamara TaxID=45834 RepID=UPI0024868210|nr:CASP-like protein 1E1 [Solanum dulcamara]